MEILVLQPDSHVHESLVHDTMEIQCQLAYVLRLSFCPKMASEAISEHLILKISRGSMPIDPPSLAC